MQRTARKRWSLGTIGACLAMWPACARDTEDVADGASEAMSGSPGALDGGAPSVGGHGSQPPQTDGGAGGAPEPADTVCEPGQTVSCYSGPERTRDVGECQAGIRTCAADGRFGECEGQRTPERARCDGLDHDCNGTLDDEQDDDRDGFDVCDDCCDDPRDCPAPELVNPAAYDFADNGLDDDCSGAADDAGVCDDALASDSTDPLDYARALDVCSLAGVKAQLSRDGTQPMDPRQRSLREKFGAALVPQRGARLVVLSTGTAADPSQTAPAHVPFDGATWGFDAKTTSPAPPDWLAAHDGVFPSTPGCPPPIGGAAGAVAYDAAMLSLELKVPSNARAFSIKAYFLSSEYPEYVCSPFNDLFVALLDSAYDAEPENPPDKNLAVHREGDETFPIGVNLAASASSLFSACVAGETGCVAGAVAGEQDSCKTSAELAGTGFDVPAPGKCGEDAVVGGGTGWLELHGNVVPGESAKLRLIIWDTADHITDSLVLLDDFEWLPLEASAGVKLCPGCEVSAE